MYKRFERSIYKYEKIEKPELYLPCPPDTGNDLQPNIIPTTTKKRHLTKKRKRTGKSNKKLTKNIKMKEQKN